MTPSPRQEARKPHERVRVSDASIRVVGIRGEPVGFEFEQLPVGRLGPLQIEQLLERLRPDPDPLQNRVGTFRPAAEALLERSPVALRMGRRLERLGQAPGHAGAECPLAPDGREPREVLGVVGILLEQPVAQHDRCVELRERIVVAVLNHAHEGEGEASPELTEA